MPRRRIPTSRGPQLELAGALCVAFVNTAGARPDNGQQGVATYDELLGWSQRIGIVSALEAERLSRRADDAPAEAAAALRRAIELRDSLVRLFLATARGRPLTSGDLRDLNGALTATLPALRLVPGEHGVTWGWAGDEDALDRMLWPVLHSAADVLIAAEGRPHVRQCAAEDCVLFFVDRTPTRHRRWCEMRFCGNRVKSRRHYRRLGKP